jgi:hypothetical protein
MMTNEQTREQTREQYQSFLKAGVCTVTFTKVNGETRVMKCTLNPAFIPAVQVPAAMSEGKELERSIDVLRVFDTESHGWRSFRIDSVTEFSAGA